MPKRVVECVDCDDPMTEYEVKAFSLRCTFCHHWKHGQDAQARGQSYSSGWQVWK